MAFAIAVLAGTGVDALVRGARDHVWEWAGIGFSVIGVVGVVLLLVTTGNLIAGERSIRAHSFIWPIADAVFGLAVVGVILLDRRRHGKDWARQQPSPVEAGDQETVGPAMSNQKRGDRSPSIRTRGEGGRFRLSTLAGFGLLACETGFLIAAGAPLWSSSPTVFTPTPAVAALQRYVGTSTVGLGPDPSFSCTGLGIQPDANVAFGVHELAVYDPMVPKKYFTSFADVSGESAGDETVNVYCPALTLISEARLYGVAFILESRGTPAPKGSRFVARLGMENLYHVPRSYPATLTPLDNGHLPSNGALGTPLAVTDTDPAHWHLVADSATPQVLRLRLTDAPGWHASLDGKPLALEDFAGTMLQARIPPGRHTIELNYWPATFSAGITIGACSFVGLLAALVVDAIRRRRQSQSEID